MFWNVTISPKLERAARIARLSSIVRGVLASFTNTWQGRNWRVSAERVHAAISRCECCKQIQADGLSAWLVVVAQAILGAPQVPYQYLLASYSYTAPVYLTTWGTVVTVPVD